MANLNARITACSGVIKLASHSFPSCLWRLCENKFHPRANSSFSFETFCWRTRFETEAKGNLEMAWCPTIHMNTSLICT